MRPCSGGDFGEWHAPDSRVLERLDANGICQATGILSVSSAFFRLISVSTSPLG